MTGKTDLWGLALSASRDWWDDEPSPAEPRPFWEDCAAAAPPAPSRPAGPRPPSWFRQHKVITTLLGVYIVLVQLPLSAVGVAAILRPSTVPPASAVEPMSVAPEPGDQPAEAAPIAPTDTDVRTHPEPAADSSTEESLVSAQPGTALATVALLEVKGRAPKTGYARDLFGSGWVDTDRNGCDTRNDMLARDLTGTTVKPGTHGCVVLTGTLADPYSGTVIPFQRGNDTSTAVQIDHVVALSDAWQKGAQQWDADTRVTFANDSLNLLAVDGPLNQQKGDGDAATWLPPNKAFRCAYVARQIAVKHQYGLWVTEAEQGAMTRTLSVCPREPLPAGTATGGSADVDVHGDDDFAAPVPLPAGPPAGSAAPAPAPAVPVAPVPDPAPAEAVYYKNCSAARAAGAAPVRVGDAGYGTHLDRDRDGVGCE